MKALTMRGWFTILAVGAMVAVIARSWDGFASAVLEAGARLPLAALLIGIGLVGGARSWAALAPQATRGIAFSAYLAAQPAKYLPLGGGAQAVAQIGLSAGAASARSSTGVSWLVHGALQVSAAAAIGALGIWLPRAGTARSLISIGSVAVAAVILWAVRPSRAASVIDWVATKLGRRSLSTTVPTARQIRHAWLWTCLPLVLSGAAFYVLLPDDPTGGQAIAAVSAFTLAWAAGYLVVPLPSGAGAREFVLVGLVDWLPAGAVIGVSVTHRVATLLAEMVVLVLLAWGQRRFRDGSEV